MKKLLNNLVEKANYFADEIFAFISEPECPGCKNILVDPHLALCDNCQSNLTFPGDGPVCLICRRPEGVACRCHLEKQTDMPKLYYWSSYTDVIRDLIHQFKFAGHSELGKYLTGEALGSLSEKLRKIKFDYIVPVPMLQRDKRQRGFNQTELIAETISHSLNIPVKSDLLIKVKEIELQANLGAKERWENIVGAFAVENKSEVRGQSILLVDDIVTTGATCFESAKQLYSASAKSVTVFALVSNKS